ncbi:MAG: pyridoxamine 5'-phosphate oxidase family protein, partial [Acutalibacteraceae bacterium]|nr:pyridoxamine 5'-phosphate oxidase family protein [Acutalibacteraceae bacterium]
FTVWQEGPKEEGEWWYHMKSVICFGRAEVMDDGDEKYEKAKNFGAKYFPTKEQLDEELAHSYARVNMVRIRVDHMTGKRVKEN